MIIWHKWPEERPEDFDEAEEDFFVVDEYGFLIKADYYNGTWCDELPGDCTSIVRWWTMINMPKQM